MEGSTRLLHELGAEGYAEALAEHRRVIRDACAREGGVEVDTQGDAFFFGFPSAPGALAAAEAFTDALASMPVRVRVGLHTGTPLLAEEGYVGADVHVAARVASAGAGGQVVVSSTAASLLEPADAPVLTSLGSHRLKDVSEPISLYQLGEGDFPPLKTIANSNLPSPASSFIGREEKLYEADLLLQRARLLTIMGPGGQGKTRFALELARRAREERFADYRDGVFACFFASLRDPALVLPTIAQALSVREQPGEGALEALASYFEGRRILLLLDNLEHLLETASELSTLLQRSPGLTLLVTSRERLRIQGETSYALPPLPEEEGVALFCERAVVLPSPEIVALAVRLEGLPLAIELAAARLAILTPTQLLARLGSRLDILKGSRDADPRQQTLRATIEWSYDLLTPEEQRHFAALSVFAGGCTVEAAEEVCSVALDTLQSLVDKSLLRFTDGRFWMLETIREFAAEQLVESGEQDEMCARHAEHFLALAEELEPPLMFVRDEEWVAQLTEEVDNVRAALDHLAGRPDPVGELRLLGALFRFWLVAGLVREGYERTIRALERADPRRHPHLRIKLLYAAAISGPPLGELEAGRRYDEERLAIARAVGDRRMEAIALNDLGLNARDAGDLDAAELLLEQSGQLAASLEDTETAAVVSSNLAEVALVRSDYARAAGLSARAIEAANEVEDPWRLIPTCIHGLALLGLRETERAGELFRQLVEPMARMHGPIYTVEALDGLATARAALRPVWAARVFGATDAARERGGFGSELALHGLIEQARARSRAEAGAEVWDAAYADGRALTLEEAIAYAVEEEGP